MPISDRGDRGALAALGMALAALVLITAITTWSGEPADQQIEKPNPHAADNGQNGDVTQPVPSIVVFSPWEDSYAQWFMAFMSLAATGVSVWAVRLVRRSLRQTRRATRAAVDANTNTLNSINQEQANAERELRAYVFVVDLEITDVNSPKFSPQIHMEFRNYGQTPASKVVIEWGPTFVFVGNASQKKNRASPEATKEDGPAMAPGRTQFGHYVIPKNLWSQMKKTIPKGFPKMYVLGVITYEDAFGKTRTTNFKLVYRPGQHRVMNGKRFSFTKGGNNYT